ncbi:MAG: Gldg family protein [Chloroflexi bacterium]|nr:Gldg family protein [Chloroflexota bacterium]
MIRSIRPMIVVARKELRTYFGSPLALIFVGVFLAVTLFLFFWVDTFFARNTADLRPLFRWMPIVMIFLVATLTMRQWSEEQRAGTLEILLTLPVPRIQLVLGKLAAVMALIVLALALTLSLVITVSFLGDLDWGPVLGGYLAAVLMASAYASIGLFVSSRTQNQIVALMITVLICGILYLLGTGVFTNLVGDGPATILRAIGIGSRFESIERGVIDLRDLVYYLSLTIVFVIFNVTSVDMKRWGRGLNTAVYRRNALLAVVLVAANLLILNTWLFPLSNLRLDLTAQGQFSLSGATRDLVRNLPEPLILRGYISDRTHPLLAPLIPNIKDLMREYEIASGGMVKAEVIDPRDNEALEREANQVYGIRPTPFRITERYETSVVNSYFDILVRYGDQFVTLTIDDLIEVRPQSGGQPDIRLRNLEFDLTSSIKRVVSGFQSLDVVFASLPEPIRLTAFITPETMPQSLRDVAGRIESVGKEIEEGAEGGFLFEILDPDAPDSGINRQNLLEDYGLRPFPVALFSPESYYLHMVLDTGEENILIYPSGEMTEVDIRSSIDSAIRRGVPGFLKTVGLWLPAEEPAGRRPGGFPRSISSWNLVQNQLAQNYSVSNVDLKDGRVPAEVDVLVVIAPQGMDDKERFAIDQFLMGGGAVVVAAGRFELSPVLLLGFLAVEITEDGLQEMLASYGVTLGEALVMDPQNEPFPATVERRVGGFRVSEIQRVDYPFFVDIRRDGMARDNRITADLPAVTLQWATPLEVDQIENADREVVPLLWSTEDSWLHESTNVQPDPERFPEFGFPAPEERKSLPLAVSIRGSFDSFFKDNPLQTQATQAPTQDGEQPEGTALRSPIEKSPETSRLVVIGSSEFLDDTVLNFSRSFSADRYLLNLQFLQNAVNWSVEDEDLLGLRSRGAYTRLLKPLDEGEQRLWEIFNYGVALLALLMLGGVWSIRQRSETPMRLTGGGEEG